MTLSGVALERGIYKTHPFFFVSFLFAYIDCGGYANQFYLLLLLLFFFCNNDLLLSYLDKGQGLQRN